MPSMATATQRSHAPVATQILRPSRLNRIGVLTGSQAFGVSHKDSDFDWLIDSHWARWIGIAHEPDSEHAGASCSVRQGNINLIFGDANFRERWMLAHRHCVIERPTNKARRIHIFRHYLRG